MKILKTIALFFFKKFIYLDRLRTRWYWNINFFWLKYRDVPRHNYLYFQYLLSIRRKYKRLKKAEKDKAEKDKEK